MKQASLLLVIMMLVISLSGCAAAVNADVSEPVLSATAAEPTPLTPAPKPTPVVTTKPDDMPAFADTAKPKPSTGQTPDQTLGPNKDQGKVVVAEGFYYIKLDDNLKERITGTSYPDDDSDCQVKYADLRYIKLLHYDFNGKVREGELIVNKKAAKEVTEIFFELYKAKYALDSVRLVDDFGQPGKDTLSMEANNSSAYCYRRVNSSKKMSHHSFGGAVDINPMLNPYVNGDRVSPKNSLEYLDRTKDFEGKIDKDDLCYKLFIKRGWKWGGDFKPDPDYQHFYKDLGYDRYKP